VAEIVRGRPLEPPDALDEEVVIAAPDPDRLLVAWIDELVGRSVRSRARYAELEIVSASNRHLVAWIRGLRLELPEDFVEVSARCHDPCVVVHGDHVTASPLLG
jgi:hypothetical protein